MMRETSQVEMTTQRRMLTNAVMEMRQTYNRLAASSSLSSWSLHPSIAMMSMPKDEWIGRSAEVGYV